MEIPGLGGYNKHPLEWKFQGGERGSKAKEPSVGGGGWVFSGSKQ